MLQKLQATKKAIRSCEDAVSQKRLELIDASREAVSLSPASKALFDFIDIVKHLQGDTEEVLAAVNTWSDDKVELKVEIALKLTLISAEGYYIDFDDFLDSKTTPFIGFDSKHKNDSLSFCLWLKIVNTATSKEDAILYEGALFNSLPFEYSKQSLIDHFSALALIFNDTPKELDNIVVKYFDEAMSLYADDKSLNEIKLMALFQYFDELTYLYLFC